MPITLYDFTAPVFIHAFSGLAAMLAKADAHAAAHGLDPDHFLAARLAPDMLPLTGQVQRASDTAKGCVVRLGAAAPASFPDTEKSFAELQARIAATVDLLKGVERAALDGAETCTVELQMRDRTVTFDGLGYVARFALPNFYFHVTTAYDLMRHKGLAIGKADFLSLA